MTSGYATPRPKVFVDEEKCGNAILRKIVRFEEVVPARRFELANIRSAASICERIIVEQCALGGKV